MTQTKQDVLPVQITVIPAQPGWYMMFRGSDELWGLPIVAWQIRHFAEPRRVPDVWPLTYDGMANACRDDCQLLRDPQGILRSICSAFSPTSFDNEASALAYLKQRARLGGYYEPELEEANRAG
jgi:hypothetical protein